MKRRQKAFLRLISKTRSFTSSKKLNFLVLLALLFLWSTTTPAYAQIDPTSTPDAEGVIYIEVRPDDGYWLIAARAGITVETLLELNGLTENSVVQPGDLLIAGYGTPPATPTSNVPTATLSPPTPTATAVPIRTAICLVAFEDTNQDGVHTPDEPLRPGVTFTIFNNEAVITNYVTNGLSEPFCIENMNAGTYHITRSVNRNEVLTTRGDWALTLVRGTVLEQSFGSYTGTPTATPITSPRPTRTNIPPTAVATATLTQVNNPANDGFPYLTALLILCTIVLLISIAMLIFWVGIIRRRTN